MKQQRFYVNSKFSQSTQNAISKTLTQLFSASAIFIRKGRTTINASYTYFKNYNNGIERE